MKANRPLRRFRTNPVEIAIFAVVSMVFCNSLYHLFYDRNSLEFAALAPMTASPISEGRAPASVQQPSFLNLEVKCVSVMEMDTSANKVRLNGPLCGSDATAANGQLIRTEIINTANKFAATVFPDVINGKFSTDYIPLEHGKNTMTIEFEFQGGKRFTEELVVSKN